MPLLMANKNTILGRTYEKLDILNSLKKTEIHDCSELGDYLLSNAKELTSSELAAMMICDQEAKTVECNNLLGSNGTDVKLGTITYKDNPLLINIFNCQNQSCANSFTAEEKKIIQETFYPLVITNLLATPFTELDGKKRLVLLFNKPVDFNGEDIISVKILAEGTYSLYNQYLAQNDAKTASNRLETSLSTFKIGLWEWDLKNYTYYVNEYVECLLEASDTRALPIKLSSVIHPDERTEFDSEIERVMTGEIDHFSLEHRVKENKQWMWRQSIIRSIEFGENKKPTKIIGTLYDINAAKRTESKLAYSLAQEAVISEIAVLFNTDDSIENKMNKALAIVGEHTQLDHLFIFRDRDGVDCSMVYEWCNAGISSYKQKFQAIPYSRYPSWLQLLIKSPIFLASDSEKLPKDLQKFFSEFSINSMLVAPIFVNENYYGFIGGDNVKQKRKWLQADITLIRTVSEILTNACELQEMINTQRENEQQIRSILASIPDLLFSFDDSGNCLSYSVKTIPKEPAIPLEDLVGKNIFDVLHETIARQMLRGIRKALKFGQAIFEVQMQKSSGPQDYEIRIVKQSDNRVITLVRNISDIKNYQNKLKEAKLAAEEANRSKSEFLANVSHEIRTPMNAILGFSESLRNKVTDPSHKKLLETIVASGKTLLSLINDILDLSKIEAGKLDIQPEPLSISSIMQEILQIFRQKIEDKGLHSDLTIGKEIPKVLLLDEVRLRQILFNLTGNAIKFTHHGFIHLAVEATPISEEGTVNIRLQVNDTGVGIANDQLVRIFEAFSQTTGQSTRKYGGTGLGLAITKRLVEKMNGQIWVESEQGKGSSFIIELKDVEATNDESLLQPVSTAIEPDIIEFQGSKVLFTDDVQYNLDVVKTFLEDHDLELYFAQSGEDALDVIADEMPDLVFMDLKMGEISGYDVARTIKADNKYKKIPIIALSASVMGDEIDRLGFLFDSHLLKPVNRSDLIRVLTDFLPYTEKIGKEIDLENVNDEEFLEGELENIPEIIAKLETLENKWESIKNADVIFDVDDFVAELDTKIGEKRPKIVNEFIETLKTNLMLFDINAIKRTLQKYPDLIAKLKSYS